MSDEKLGNYPQAFAHVGLIRAAFALDRARRGSRHGAERSGSAQD